MVKTMPKLDIEELKKEKPTEMKGPEEMAADLKPMTKEDAMNIPEVAELTKISGVGPALAMRLYNNGYTLTELGTGRTDEIKEKMGVTFAQAKVWVDAAMDLLVSGMKLMKVSEFTKFKTDRQMFFKTGSNLFNGLLGGGVSTMASTGLSGPLATGKTMASEDCIIDALTDGKYYTCPKCYVKLPKFTKCSTCGVVSVPIQAVYIETEPDTLYEKRLDQIARGRGIHINLDNLYVCPADQISTMKGQFLQYKLIQKQLEKGANIHLVVIDSFNSNIRAGWGLTNMLPIRSRELAEHFNLIKYLASKYNIAWLITCQVISAPRPDQQHSSEAKFGSKNYPVGGDILLHSVNQWVALDQIKGDLYKATLFDSSYLPKKDITFQLTASGLKDGVV